MNQSKLIEISSKLGGLLITKGLSFTSAESCTGGWVSQSLTSVPGSSGWFGYGFVVYSNAAKSKILGVSTDTLNKFGAVSEEVVEEMIRGALEKSGADLGVAISGIAGPGGGSEHRPIGTVCFAWLLKGREVVTLTEVFKGNRDKVRFSSVKKALLISINLIEES